MKKILLMAVAAIMVAMSVQAQVPAEVKDVMSKCRKAMSNPAGMEYQMDIKSYMGPVKLTTMHLQIGSKGVKEKNIVTMSVLGQEITMESGFDGTQEWKADEDTVVITKTTKKSNAESDLRLGLDSQYKKARMKVKDDCYEIVFTEPIDPKDEAKKVTVKVDKKTYYIRELKTGARGATVDMVVSKIRIGLKDDYFKLNLSKYPTAVVVRK